LFIGKPMNKWSRKFDCCQVCGTTEWKAYSAGMCKPCSIKRSGEPLVHEIKYQDFLEGKDAEHHPIADGDYNLCADLMERFGALEYEELKKQLTQSQIRYHRLKSAEGNHTEADRYFLLDLAGNKCQACGRTDKLTIDHIVPISKEGRNDIINLQVLCKSCNSSKNNHHNTDYRSPEFKQAVSRYAYRNIAAYESYPLQLESGKDSIFESINIIS